ncbi:MAG: amidase [Bacteroidales bacterium]|nr:amidase [Bacteroidales bacterium]
MKNLAILLLALAAVLISSCNNKEQSPQIDLNDLSIAAIHDAYRAGDYNCRELTQACIDRIKKYDSTLNAISYINHDALETAAELDREYNETGVLRPLHGIPLLVKDNINTAGMPTTAGSLALENFIPGEDAFIIKKLVEAGAVIIGKTNMAEWAFSPMHTESSTAGTTRNPYNTDYVPAGSSGGTAAGIAADMGTAGLGTDTGNSIRGPSSHCALVGFRTTMGLVSRSAIIPLYLRNDVVGPMCRSVEDATRVLQVIAGYDPADPLTEHSKGNIPGNYMDYLQKDGMQGARIGVLGILSNDNPDPEIRELFEQAVEDMRSLGAEVINPVDIPRFEELSANQWCSMFKNDVEDYLEQYVQSDTMQTIEDIIEAGSKSEFAASRLKESAQFEGRYGSSNIPCLDAFNDERRIAFRRAIEDVMDSLQLDALVYPSWNNKPAHIDAFMDEYKGDNSQVIAPHTGQPAFTVPMGYTGENLPAGLQFLGRMFDEATLIRLTYAYEQGTQHRRPLEL